PPTKPGVKFKKFHFVFAASRTAFVSMSILLKTIDNSFIKAILISRCEFSMTLEASATLMDSASCTPASIIDPRSEEHTSELQSRFDLVCRLLLEKKKRRPWCAGTVCSAGK